MTPIRRGPAALRTAAAALAMFLLGAAPAHAGAPADTTDTRLLLSWDAPSGQPRAVSSHTGTCGDTTASDTLYLCMVPGRDSPTFNAFTAELRVRPTGRDSLAAFWLASDERGDLTRFDVRFAPDSMLGAASPFQVQGIGRWKGDRVPGGVRLRLLFAVPHTGATPVRAGVTYVLAQVLVRRPAPDSEACRRALCVEWLQGVFSWSLEYEAAVTRGDRLAGLGGPVDRVCAEWRGSTARPWSPPPRPTH